MLRSLLIEIVGDARQLVGAIMLLLAGIYVSGFLIVNLYLGKFGVVRMEIVQAQFVAAGVLFMFVAGLAGLFSLLVLVVVLELVDYADWVWQNLQFEQYLGEQSKPTEQSPAGAQDSKNANDGNQRANAAETSAEQLPAGAQDSRSSSLRQQVIGWLLKRLFSVLGWRLKRLSAAKQVKWLRFVTTGILLALTMGVFFGFFLLLEWMCCQMQANFLAWAGRGIPRAEDIIPQLEPLTQLEGLSAFFVLALWFQMNRLRRPFLRAITFLTIILFLSIQAYSLIWFADRLYGELPRSVGGGKPALVRFLADRDGLQNLEDLGVQIEQWPVDNALGKTKKVQLIDQKMGEAPSATYTILPCSLQQTCQAIEFDGELVLGLVYEESP